ncbi:MAG: protoporphyrinogen oxidase [Streptosporangiaceae bacterium]|jgi:oxygen-dependent protoporphyrinogen oxidase|nr:protoporphyrinogen oxidase [Actinomycetota bacterium]
MPAQNEPAGRPRRIVIVGGGIAGLAAAFSLRETGAEVTVLEGSARLGGKLAVSEVAGIAVDEGAEALLARRPEGTDLIGAVGLADQLRQPGTTQAAIWSRGRLCPLPRRQMFGVPADLDEVAGTGILSAAGLARAREDLVRPETPRPGDVSVTGYVGARFGEELVDRLVDPLLGGVYAGRSQDLSFEATLGPLAAAASRHRSLADAAAAVLDGARPAAARPSGPVFTTLAGGLGMLPDAVAAALAAAASAGTPGAAIRTSAMVRELARRPDGWRLTIGSARAPEYLDADAIVLALPARPAARLLSGVPGAAAAAAALGEIEYASMALVTLAYPVSAFPEPPAGSGYLVPAVDGRAVKAVTFSSVKWPHLAAADPGITLVRCSVGRIGEEALLQRPDSELTAIAAGDLAAATGISGQPLDSRVTRWGGGLPQYNVGHLDRVARIRSAIAALPGVAVCGAAYDGVGIPACIATGRLAAEQVLDFLDSAARGPACAESAAGQSRAGTGGAR